MPRTTPSSLALIAFLAVACACARSPVHATIDIDPTRRYQTMRGLEVTAQAGQEEIDGFDRYAPELFDMAVEAGVERVRLEIRRGIEGSRDAYALWQNGDLDDGGFRESWYAGENDDDDPRHIVAERFHFGRLDHSVRTVIDPLRERLAADGRSLYVNLCYVDFGTDAGFSHQHDPEEYAEFIEAAFLHLKATFGWTPDALEVILEPDNGAWKAKPLARALVATAKRLAEHDLRPDFIAPSAKNTGVAWRYFDQMREVAGAVELLSEFSYHRYGGARPENLEAIAERAAKHGIAPAMLEHIGSGINAVFEDLTVAQAASWQQYTLAFSQRDTGGQLFLLSPAGSGATSIHPGRRTPAISQVFQAGPRGSVRVEATASSSAHRAMAFQRTDGGLACVIVAYTRGSVSVAGLPAGTYALRVSTADGAEAPARRVIVREGVPHRLDVAAPGVLSLVPEGRR